MKLPSKVRSARFRLTVLYSTLLFALAGTALAVTYFAVSRFTQPAEVTELIVEVWKKGRPTGRDISVAEISEIQAAVNYQTLEHLRDWSLIALAGLFLASLVIGWVLSGRVLRPVGAITRTAREIQATDLSRRIRLDGPRDELRDLADTIDSMLDRLDDAFQQQRQLIDDASHELRSPLAIIRTNLDASLAQPEATEEEKDRAVAMVDRATTRMSHLVEDLLATARRDAQAMADVDVELTEVAREAGEEYGSSRVVLRYDLTPDLQLIGDPDALRRAAGNLLTNAGRLAPSGSTVTVATGRAGTWLWLAVVDQGPGISTTDLPRVFDRFWRGTTTPTPVPAATGADIAVLPARPRNRERRTGLGLAIVRQIVESHGGQVAAYSTLGVGSTFVLWLPAADRSDDLPPPAASPWQS